jgi:hypothetical protein
MITFKRFTAPLTTGAFALLSAGQAFATQTDGVFGDNPGDDLNLADDARAGVVDILSGVLDFMALVAVVVIVIAGIRMVVSSGNEDATGAAKKTILWAVIGLIVILLAGAIVDFIADVATNVTN